MKRIGIYPGTFNPLHDGHIAFALSAIKTCQLDSVVFMPETKPRGKLNVTHINQRSLHIGNSIQFDSRLQLYRSTSVRFSVSGTLHELKTNFSDSALTLLIGSDVVVNLHSWPDVAQLTEVFHLAIGVRASESISDIKHALDRLTAITSKPHTYCLITTPYADLTSSQLRGQK